MSSLLKKSLPNLLSLIAILAVVLFGFHAITLGSLTMKWDMMNQFLPCRHFISDCLQHHIFPLWCPYINFGYPFYADPQSGLFYPITWLIALTVGYNPYTIGLEYVLHVCIAALAFFYLLKRFELDNYTATAFAIVYCMSGVFISNAQHLPWIVTMAWLPLIMLNFKSIFEDRTNGSIAGLALFLYLALTGGYPGFFIILFYFFAVYGIFKMYIVIKAEGLSSATRLAILLGISAILFLVLTGGYLYSFSHSLQYIARGKPVTLQEANNVAVSPHALVSILFPFATGCSSFRLDTDISMANIYCGFLALPLLFIAVTKTRFLFFQKALSVFAFVCLLAAAGKYLFLRSWLYNLLPGMDMLRHAAIFRVFTVFGIVFISATGFGWLVNAVTTKTDIVFVKRIFVTWLILLLSVFAFSVVKSGYVLKLLVPFSESAVADFNAHQNVYAHITTQLLFQLPLLLLFIFILFQQQIASSTRLILLCCIVVTEMVLSAQLNMPSTVVSNIKPSGLEAKLDKLSSGFPVPPLNPMSSFSHFSDGSTLPIWYNLSFFKKIPAKDGFNSFYLQNVDDLSTSSKQEFFMQRPVVFCDGSATKFSIQKFEPGNISIACDAGKADVLHLQQNYYQGWWVYIDGKMTLPEHELCSMSTSLPAGNHSVKFVYARSRVQYLFLISILSALLLTAFWVRSQVYQE